MPLGPWAPPTQGPLTAGGQAPAAELEGGPSAAVWVCLAPSQPLPGLLRVGPCQPLPSPATPQRTGVLWAMGGSGGFPSVFSLPLLPSTYRRGTLLENGCRWNLGGDRTLYSVDLHCVESVKTKLGKTITIPCLLTGVGTWAHSSFHVAPTHP